MTTYFKLPFRALLCLCYLSIALCLSLNLSAQGCIKFYGVQQTPNDLSQYSIVAVDSLTGNLTLLNTVTNTAAGGTIFARGITANPDEQKLYYIQQSVTGNSSFYRIKTISTIDGALGDAIILSASTQIPVAVHYDCDENKLFLLRAAPAGAATNINIEYIDLAAGTLVPILSSLITVNNFSWWNTAYDVLHNELVFAAADMIYRVNTATGSVSTITAPAIVKSIEIDPFENQIIVQAYNGTAHIYSTVSNTFSTLNTDYNSASPTNNLTTAYNPFSNRYWEMSFNTTTNSNVVNYIDLNNGNILTTYPANNLVELTAGYPCTAVPDFSFTAACAGAPVQFTDASWGAGEWQWNFGDPSSGDDNTSTQTNPTHTYYTPGTYTVSLTVSGCLEVSSKTAQITVNGAPIAELPDNVLSCANSYTLNAGNAVGATYLWSTGANTPSITVNSDGIYWVEISANSCVVRDTVDVNLGNSNATSIWADAQQNICATQTQLNNNGLEGIAYAWSSGETTNSIDITQSGTYSLSITQADGCILSDEITINLSDPINVSVGNDTTICNGNTLAIIAITSNNNANNNYLWSSGATTQQITAAQSGTYSITVSNSICTARDSLTLTINPPLTVDFGTLPTNICTVTGETVLLNATIANAQTYTWLPDNGNNPTLNVSAPGTYSVTVTDNTGCTASDTATFGNTCQAVFALPTAFSPNGDNINETFMPTALFVRTYTLKVFDRWGNLVFTSDQGDTSGWRGKNDKDRDMPLGVYIWVATYTDENDVAYDLKGNVTLIR